MIWPMRRRFVGPAHNRRGALALRYPRKQRLAKPPGAFGKRQETQLRRIRCKPDCATNVGRVTRSTE